jgi:SpoIID/LytB domain protein
VSGAPVWVAPADGGVVGVPARGRAYRGVVQAVAGPGLRLVNEVDVETYLKGMGEVPASWPAAAQEAQAIAARTWVLRAMAVSGEVCDFDRCQVYVGATREAPGQTAAVDGTRGLVLTYGGALAASVYSADAGGISASTFEGFGTPDGTYPYLTTVRYDTPDPLPWAFDVALDDVARRFGYGGTITGVRVTQAGPSGRALEVTIDGTAGSMAVPGRQFASGLGLRSTLFTPTLGSATAAPAPPPTGTGFAEQAFPDDARALANAVAAASTSSSRSARTGERTRAERATDRPPAAVADLTDVADRPATVVAVGLLGAATAFAMARLGGLVPAEPAVAGSPVRPAIRIGGRFGRRSWPAERAPASRTATGPGQSPGERWLIPLRGARPWRRVRPRPGPRRPRRSPSSPAGSRRIDRRARRAAVRRRAARRRLGRRRR